MTSNPGKNGRSSRSSAKICKCWVLLVAAGAVVEQMKKAPADHVPAVGPRHLPKLPPPPNRTTTRFRFRASLPFGPRKTPNAQRRTSNVECRREQSARSRSSSHFHRAPHSRLGVGHWAFGVFFLIFFRHDPHGSLHRAEHASDHGPGAAPKTAGSFRNARADSLGETRRLTRGRRHRPRGR